MQYKVYTKNRVIKYPVVFKCEHCGKINVVANPFVISASYDDKYVITQKGREKRERVADDNLEMQQSNLFYKITNEVKERDVKDTGFVCVCSNCNTIPKWSRFRNIALDKLCGVSAYIAFIMALFVCLPILSGAYYTWPNLLIPLGIYSVVHVPRYILYNSKKKEVMEMDEEYMPIVCENEQQFEEALLKVKS